MMGEHGQRNGGMTRRQIIRSASGLYIVSTIPFVTGANCTPEQIDAAIRLIELGLRVADRTLGYLETRTRSSSAAEKFVYECLYAASSTGEPTGAPIQENDGYVVTTPADGQWHETDLVGFEIQEEGDFVVVAEGTGFQAISDTVQVRSS